MSWSATVRRLRDPSRPMGQRVNALHSLLANHHAPLGFEESRRYLRAQVGLHSQFWTEAQLLAAFDLLDTSRSSYTAYRGSLAVRRKSEKIHGRRSPTKKDMAP